MMRVAIVGASGFVGSACVAEASRLGMQVKALTAPRLTFGGSPDVENLYAEAERTAATFSEVFLDVLRNSDVVINAAGAASAVSRNRAALLGANALLPASLACAISEGPARLLHISSAAVQGDTAVLDETPRVQPFSPYSESKAAAEAALAQFPTTTTYRPTSVHGPTRPVTRSLVRYARSPFSSVAGDGRWPTPQVLVENVASGILHVARASNPPAIVLHPSEQLSCLSLLETLGERRPRRVPVSVARAAVNMGKRSSRARPVARRLEMAWFGQDQKRGWLDEEGWQPRVGCEAWAMLGRVVNGKAE